MQVNLFLQTYYAIHGFIAIEVHYVITKYSEKPVCKKGIKSIDFSNIFPTNSSYKPIVYVRYYVCFDNRELMLNRKL